MLKMHLSEARKALPRLPGRLRNGEEGEEGLVVTRYNQPVMVVLSWKKFQSIRGRKIHG